MILRISESLSRGLIAGFAILVALPLSFHSVRMALAAVEANKQTAVGFEKAVRTEPKNAEYWYRFAHFQQFNLDETNPDQAKALLKAATVLDPKYTDAWLDLATAYELEGNKDEARDAYQHAKKSYPASPDVSWRYGNFLLRDGDIEGAYPEFRLALTADPGRAPSAFSRCYRANPDVEEILDKILPPSPVAYIGIVKEAADTKQLAVAQIVWKRLLALNPRLTVADIEPLVYALVVEGNVREAYRVWEEGAAKMSLPDLRALQNSAIWDPSFESGVRDSSFSWHYQPLVQGLVTALDTSEKRSGKRSLRLTFDGRHNPNLDIACIQAPVYPSTSYDFSAWIKTRQLTTARGIGFRIRSYTHGGEAPIQSSRELYGTNAWTPVDFVYAANSDTYRVNICAYRERDLDTDEHISGTAWIDDVNLVPRPVESGKP